MQQNFLKNLFLMNFLNFWKIKICYLSINQVFILVILVVVKHNYLQSLITSVFLCFDGNLPLETRGVILEIPEVF